MRRALNTHREHMPMSSFRRNVNKFNTQPTIPEHTYKDSSTFLKGTQSSNPHNDYCQHFVDTGQRPQNFIRDVGLTDRFEEYPKLRELIRLKVYQINVVSPLNEHLTVIIKKGTNTLLILIIILCLLKFRY